MEPYRNFTIPGRDMTRCDVQVGLPWGYPVISPKWTCRSAHPVRRCVPGELGTIGLSVCGKVKTRLCVFWDPVTKTAKGCIYGRWAEKAETRYVFVWVFIFSRS